MSTNPRIRSLMKWLLCTAAALAVLPGAFANPTLLAQVDGTQIMKPRLATSMPNKPNELGAAWAVEAFRTRLKERSQGRIDLQVFWGGQLYSEVAALRAMLDGAVEFSVAGLSNSATFTRAYLVLEMPFLFPSADVLAKTVIHGPFNKRLKDAVGKDQPNLVPLMFMLNESLRDLECNKKVLVPSDLRGMKVRTTESPADLTTWRTLGAIASPIAWAETYTAGSQNLIQCLGIAAGYWVLASRANEWTGHITRLGYASQLQALNVSQKFLSSLPPATRNLIIEVAREVETEAVEIDIKFQNKWIDLLRTEHKQNIYTLDDAQRKEWMSQARPVYDAFNDRIPSGLLDEIRAYVKAAQ